MEERLFEIELERMKSATSPNDAYEIWSGLENQDLTPWQRERLNDEARKLGLARGWGGSPGQWPGNAVD